MVVEGDLAEVYVKPGETVTAGQKIAQLVNQDLELKIAELRAASAISLQSKSRVWSGQQARYRGSSAADQIGDDVRVARVRQQAARKDAIDDQEPADA